MGWRHRRKLWEGVAVLGVALTAPVALVGPGTAGAQTRSAALAGTSSCSSGDERTTASSGDAQTVATTPKLDAILASPMRRVVLTSSADGGLVVTWVFAGSRPVPTRTDAYILSVQMWPTKKHAGDSVYTTNSVDVAGGGVPGPRWRPEAALQSLKKNTDHTYPTEDLRLEADSIQVTVPASSLPTLRQPFYWAAEVNQSGIPDRRHPNVGGYTQSFCPAVAFAAGGQLTSTGSLVAEFPGPNDSATPYPNVVPHQRCRLRLRRPRPSRPLPLRLPTSGNHPARLARGRQRRWRWSPSPPPLLRLIQTGLSRSRSARACGCPSIPTHRRTISCRLMTWGRRSRRSCSSAERHLVDRLSAWRPSDGLRRPELPVAGSWGLRRPGISAHGLRSLLLMPQAVPQGWCSQQYLGRGVCARFTPRPTYRAAVLSAPWFPGGAEGSSWDLKS